MTFLGFRIAKNIFPLEGGNDIEIIRPVTFLLLIQRKANI